MQMARPRTTLGTGGNVKLVGQVQIETGRWIAAPPGTKPTRWRARVKFRDLDGVLRDVERFASTKGKAETKLRVALAERVAPRASGEIRADMALIDAASAWRQQAERADSGLADNTRAQYRSAIDRYVKGSKIGGLTLREANRVHVLEGWLQSVADDHGSGAAKTARSVVSSVITLAVRYGALDFNAMRDVRPARAKTKKTGVRDTERALTRSERDHLLKIAENHEAAKHLDLSDFVYFMAGTGCRIGEARGQLWRDVDLDAGTVLIRGTKTKGSVRRLALPPWLCERLTERALSQGTAGLVFHSPGTADRTKPRDHRNVTRVLRSVLDDAGFPWATSHTLRRTVASLIDAEGLPVALAADVLGHKDASMTARLYLGRRGDTSAAAAVL
jgi:integrase